MPTGARLLVAFALLLAGCAGLTKSGIGKPKVSVESAKLASLSFQGATLQFGFGIDNPNPLGLHLDGFDYALSVEGARMMEGRQDSKLDVAAKARTTLELPVTLKYQQLWTGLRQVVEKKEAGYVLEAGFAFDVPVIGRVRIPVRREGNLPLLRMPKIRLEKVAVAGLSARSADLALAVAVDNPNDLDADLQGIDTALRFNDRSVGRLVYEQTVHLPANGTQRLTVPLRLDLLQLGSAVFRLLSSGGAVDYGLDGNLSLTSAEPAFVPAEVPFSASGRAELSSGASGTR